MSLFLMTATAIVASLPAKGSDLIAVEFEAHSELLAAGHQGKARSYLFSTDKH